MKREELREEESFEKHSKHKQRESRRRSTVSSEKREAITIMVRGMKDAKERAQINARSER